MKGVPLIVAALFGCSALSSAQTSSFQPIDPLVRPTEGKGGYSLSAALNYAPDALLSSEGTFTSNGLGLGVSGSYNVNADLSVFGRSRFSGNLAQQLTADSASGQ